MNVVTCSDSEHVTTFINETYLVGVMTRANIPYGSSHNVCNIGRAKAAVFPLPVFAQPMQSLPAKHIVTEGRMRGKRPSILAHLFFEKCYSI